jgi:hypothetical protein
MIFHFYYFILLIKRNCENNVHFQTPVQLQFKHRPSIPNLMSELVEGYLGHTINLTQTFLGQPFFIFKQVHIHA